MQAMKNMIEKDWEATKRLGDLVCGKKVHVIGGCDELVYRPFGGSNDVTVVRINLHFQRQGGPCDVLYVGPGVAPSGEIKAKCIVYPANNGVAGAWVEAAEKCGAFTVRYMPIQTLGISAYGAQHEWLNGFMKELGTLPLTGILAIKHLLQFPFEKMLISGMDLYSGGKEIPYERGSHELFSQVDWLKRTALIDGRLLFWSTMSKIVNGEVPLQKLEHGTWHGIDFVRPV